MAKQKTEYRVVKDGATIATVEEDNVKTGVKFDEAYNKFEAAVAGHFEKQVSLQRVTVVAVATHDVVIQRPRRPRSDKGGTKGPKGAPAKDKK